MSSIKEQVKNYILEAFVEEDEAASINDDSPLLSSGIIDSVSSLELVDFIENTFEIQFQAHEVDHDNLNTLNKIEAFIQSKKG